MSEATIQIIYSFFIEVSYEIIWIKPALDLNVRNVFDHLQSLRGASHQIDLERLVSVENKVFEFREIRKCAITKTSTIIEFCDEICLYLQNVLSKWWNVIKGIAVKTASCLFSWQHMQTGEVKQIEFTLLLDVWF